ncbi:Na+/H+ antiporter subunit E [Aquamicrobium segne]|uniref:Na+/H+ antiporter subunit E n=1 Tax=Aquamicrobium segne TaxID=469547 RepID=A0ABW0H067_9HYPH
MRRVLPYPLMTAALLLMWLLLNGFSPGHLLLGAILALVTSQMVSALQPAKPRIRRWSQIPLLIGRVFIDIFHSNVAVAGLVLGHRRNEAKAAFVAIPLQLRDKTGLAVLACIITATPGTAWIEYRSGEDLLMIHVLDVDAEESYAAVIKHYESFLLEIFE